MIDKLLTPSCAFSLAILIIAAAIFIKIVGNPFKSLLNFFKSILPYTPREIKGEAGLAGQVNMVIIFFTFVLSMAIIFKPTISSFLGFNEKDYLMYATIILGICVVTFMASLKMLRDADKESKMFKDVKGKWLH